MKVLVANNMAPFSRGGAEVLAETLVEQLRRHGHESELMRIPFRHAPYTNLLQEMALVRALELVNVDRLIALKFPAYLLRHPEKSIWLVHQYRQAYDLFDAGLTDIPDDAAGREVREVIAAADVRAMAESRNVYGISPTVTARLQHYVGVSAGVLYHPLSDPELFTGGRSRGYLFAGGRVNSMKRQRLLIEAVALAAPGVRLVIAGPPEDAAIATELAALVETLGVADRVTLDLRYLARAEIAGLVNHSLACVTVPLDEDSLSYVGMEAAQANKPLLTTSDSGGILGLVQHGVTGWVAEPTPQALADAMSAITTSGRRAVTLGRNLGTHLSSLDISWDRVVETLLR